MRTERSPQVTTRDTQKLRLIRQRFSPAPAACDSCGGDRQALTREEAAAFARTGLADIEARVASGRLHRTRDAGGPPLICLDSLISDGCGPADSLPRAGPA